jgi:DNA-binding winged helix-turn-helix (wHTH) protein/Tfp pilus assembly protein PilF
MSVYEFGPFRLEPDRRVLSLDGVPLALGPRVVSTLTALVAGAGDLVTKAELLDRIWPGEDVEEANLTQNVHVLRKLLRAHGLDPAIETVPRHGYRFVAPVRRIDPPRIAGPAYPPGPLGTARSPRARGPVWVRAVSALAIALVTSVVVVAAQTRPVPAGVALSSGGAERYRLARYYWNLRTPATLAKSEALFASVTRTDPQNSLGYSGLADAEMMIADYRPPGTLGAREVERVRANLRRALALDPDSADAHAALAMFLVKTHHDAGRADLEFRRAVALDPTSAIAHHWYGVYLLERRHVQDALRELRAAAALDPVTPATSNWLALASYDDRRFGDAIHYAQLSLDLDPNRSGVPRSLGLAYEAAGDLPRAIQVFERLRRSHSHDDAADAQALLAEAYAHAGKRERARAALAAALRNIPHDYDTAVALLAFGRRQEAIANLRRFHKNDMEMAVDPRLDAIRSALSASARRA